MLLVKQIRQSLGDRRRSRAAWPGALKMSPAALIGADHLAPLNASHRPCGRARLRPSSQHCLTRRAVVPLGWLEPSAAAGRSTVFLALCPSSSAVHSRRFRRHDLTTCRSTATFEATMRREMQGLREAARLSRRQPAYSAFAYPTLVGRSNSAISPRHLKALCRSAWRPPPTRAVMPLTCQRGRRGAPLGRWR